ncbi:MAG: hypothetical protein AAFQ39_02345 [Pseudomonadota bacterium]
MEMYALLAFLAFSTFAAVIAFAVISKQRTERRMENDDAPKSRLAKDAPDR